MTDWQALLSETERKQLNKTAVPRKVTPMLATLTDNHFSDPDWIYERKLDGERCLALVNDDDTHLVTRNAKKLDSTYPEIRDALKNCELRMVIDGEIVAFKEGRSSFSQLQSRMQIKQEDVARDSPVPVYYYIFDLLYLDGFDTRALPLRARKKLLHKVLRFDAPLYFTAHRDNSGERFLEEACRKGWEGVIAKDACAPYESGRSRKWLKFKCINQQEMVIVGYTEPEGKREGFGALLLAFYRDKKLHYAGRVGTGFDNKTLKELHRQLRQRIIDQSPLDEGSDVSSEGVYWVKPELVGEISFTEWTEDNRLRHPSFLGLRSDKSPHDVIQEIPGARS